MKPKRSYYNILALLKKNPEGLSGYDIKKHFANMAFFQVADNRSNSQIYPVLHRLKEKGVLTEKLDESSGKRQRTVWKITSKGERILEEWLKIPPKFNMPAEEILAKINEPKLLSIEKNIEYLKHYIHQIEYYEHELVDTAANVEGHYAGKDILPYIQIKFDFSKNMLEAKKQWAKKAIIFFENQLKS